MSTGTGGAAGVDVGRLFPHLLRKPGLRPWQCAMAVFLFAFFVFVVQVALSLFEVLLFAGFGPMMGVQGDGSYAGAAPVLYGVALRVLYVAFAVAAVVWAFTVRPGWVVSVAGAVRWRLLLLVLPALAVAALVEWVGSGLDGSRLTPADPALVHDVSSPLGWAAVGGLVALAAGLMDEVVFRGWLAQSFGALVSHERVGLVLAAAASTAGYTWWRRPEDAYQVVCVVLVGLVLFTVATLTGGLEASLAASVGTGLALVVPYAATYGLDVATAPRSATWVDVTAALAAGALAVALSRFAGAARRGRPEGEPRTLSDLSQARGVR